MVRETKTGLEVPLHIQTRARRNEIAGLHGGALKLRITAPPVDDAANRAIVALFASLLAIPKSRLKLVSGQKSRDKVLVIEGATIDYVQSCFPETPVRKI
jgi:uncharacterized protein (TIGR00251 family)